MVNNSLYRPYEKDRIFVMKTFVYGFEIYKTYRK